MSVYAELADGRKLEFPDGTDPAVIQATVKRVIGEQKQEPGLMARIGDVVTGNLRATEETKTLPEWTTMPELNQLSMASAKTGLGTLLSNPEETVKVIKSNFPGVETRQDAKGNFILKSSVDGKEYAIPPGFSMGDIPRAIGGVAAFTPAGRATSIVGGGAAAGATQAAIEASQALTGGDFDKGDVAIAGALGAAAPAVSKLFRGKPPAPSPATPTPKTESVMQAAANAPTIQAASTPAAQQAVKSATQATEKTVEQTADDIGTLIKKASSDSLGSVRAQEKLAQLAKVNPEAKAAAERLAIDLPADVFSDDQIIKEAAGLTRSVAGSPASGAWRDIMQNAATRADEVIGQIDAATDIASVSDKVLNSLKTTRDSLAADAKKIYTAVDAQVPKNTPVRFNNLTDTILKIQDEVGNAGLSKAENKLLAMIDEGATYGRLAREKNLIGQALAGKESPYGNVEAGALKRLYGALAQDQLDNVQAVGGEELRKQLRAANFLTQKSKGLEKRIVNAFGKDVDGSIASLMKRAVTSASGGDSTALTKLLKVVPEDLQKETIASSLMNVTRAKGGQLQGGFGFSEFAKTYRGLRENVPVYAQVSKILGKESSDMLRDLYQVSKRITDARANVLTTGKANQALVDSIKAESLIGNVLNTVGGKALSVAAGAAGGGPVGAALATTLTSAISAGKKDAIEAAGKLFVSHEFNKLAIEAATKSEVPKRTVDNVIRSAAFRKLAAKVPRENLEKIIYQAAQSSAQTERQFK